MQPFSFRLLFLSFGLEPFRESLVYLLNVSMPPNSSSLWFFGTVGAAKSRVSFWDDSLNGETKKRIQSSGLVPFGQFLNSNKIIITVILITITTKQLKKGKNKRQGFWFSTYFFGNL